MNIEQGENPKDAIGDTKPPLHLIPASAEIEESLVMALGAKKYGPYNWRDTKVRASVYIAAARRHMLQWFDGEDVDSESGFSHLAHARSCMGILLDAIATDHWVDDRPPAGVAAALITKHTKDVADDTLAAKEEGHPAFDRQPKRTVSSFGQFSQLAE